MNRLPLSQGDQVELDITDLSSGGEGVGRFKGLAVFVPGALPGERVIARANFVQKKYARATLANIVDPSPYRIVPHCPVYGNCGGCQLQHLEYTSQLLAKNKTVQDALRRIGKLDHVKVLPTIGMDEPWGYRNKGQFPLAEKNERIVAGFYAPQSHELIESTGCKLQHPIINMALQKLLNVVNTFKSTVLSEQEGTDLFRHFIIKLAVATGQLMIIIVSSRHIPKTTLLVDAIKNEILGVTSLLLNINSSRTSIVLGSRWQLLDGEPTITDYIGPYRFLISGASFFQVNPVQTSRLYEKVIKYCNLTGTETVIDAYCGIGTISLFLAKKAKEVHGIEAVPEAIDDAVKNARANGIENAKFHLGQVEPILPELIAQGLKPHVVVIDPPRQGCRQEVLMTIAKANPRRIVYVSCNPATLARDVAVLTRQGYQISEVQPVDMFPQTRHVECVIEIQKVQSSK